MGLIIGKQGSGSNIPKATGTGKGFPCIGGDSAETWLQNAISRGITLYTTRNADPFYGTFEIVATKDFRTYKPLYDYAEELGLAQVELEELKRNITAILREHNGIFNTDGASHYAFCIALIDGMTVLHAKTPPYRLRAWYGYPLLHVNKKWQHVRLFSAWTEEAAPAEIYAENPVLYGNNEASVSMVPALYDRQSYYYDYGLFDTKNNVYPVGFILRAPLGEEAQKKYFDELFTRIDPPEFGNSGRLDAWPQDVDKCRIPALRFLQANSSGNYYEVVATIPSGPVSIEQRDIDPESIAAFFDSATAQFPNYYIDSENYTCDYSLAPTPAPVNQGGLGPVRPGLYYKAGRLVAIITGECYGSARGPIFNENGKWDENSIYETYYKVSGTTGIITIATSTTDIPADAKLPDELGAAGESATAQRKTATRHVRHYLHEHSWGMAETDDHKIELRIAFTIRTGSTARLVDQYRSTTVSIDGISQSLHTLGFPWKANIGSTDNPNEATLEQSTDENGHKVLTIPLDQGILEIGTNTSGQQVYMPFQVVTVAIYARFESSYQIGSFRTAPDDELDFDSYVPYRIRKA